MKAKAKAEKGGGTRTHGGGGGRGGGERTYSALSSPLASLQFRPKPKAEGRAPFYPRPTSHVQSAQRPTPTLPRVDLADDKPLRCQHIVCPGIRRQRSD